MSNEKQEQVFYTSYANKDGEPQADFSSLNAGLSSDNLSVRHSKASNVFRNAAPNISVRDGYAREHYEHFRPDEALPKTVVDEIKFSNTAYKRIGLIRNVIDLMADFGCQGISLVHKNKKWQKFYTEWANKIDFTERSERFLNLLYRLGNVVVKRSTAKLKESDVKNLINGFAGADLDLKPIQKLDKREIPWDYEFLSPVNLKILGDELGAFVGKPTYAFSLADSLIAQILKPKDKIERELVAQIPDYILKAVKSGQKNIILDPSKTSVYFYKKDDWELWSSPMLASILDDLIHFNKLKLADNAALDGVINAIRVWKLGNIEYKIMPGPAAFNRLSEVLMNNVGGGSMDLIWGPDIELVETSSESYKFLGAEKYAQTLNNIYSGLGIPPTLAGGGGTGLTNNMVSIKTLIERLEYGRTILREFWEKEIKLVQKAMGIPTPAQIVFERATLTDEVAEKALWIQLCDRDIITVESIQKRFGLIPEVQNILREREEKSRDRKKMPVKAGPFHNGNFEQDLIKLALQQGTINPRQAGVPVEGEVDAPDKSLLDHTGEQAIELAKLTPKAVPAKKKGVSGQGRPKNKKDSTKRKERRAKPLGSKAFLLNMSWAANAQKKITEVMNPLFFEMKNKKDLRELSEEEFQDLEDIKNSLLYQFNPLDEITEDNLIEKAMGKCSVPEDALSRYKKTVSLYSEQFNKQPSQDEQRRLFAAVYAIHKTIGEENNG